MADTTSTTQFKADISQLKSAMQAAQRQVRLASSEFQKASAGLDDWSKSAVGLEAKIKQLNTTLEAQKRQVALANEEWEKTKKAYGEGSAEADRAKMKLNGYEAAVKKTESQLTQYEQELDDCKNSTGKFADETDELEQTTIAASDGFTVMKGALASLVADGFRMAINAAKEFGQAVIETGMSFEQGMAQVQAVSGASAEDMALLTEKAKEMGESTKFSASESAEAFNYMAMAGWKTEDMLDGISGIMSLAAASGSDLATTSDIVTDALTAMGYQAGDAGRLADVMAAASSNANTNVEMMGQTFQYAAPLVGAMGYSMEDTAKAIGLMANSGIKGTKAGTALRSMLSRLAAPPKECAEALEYLDVSLTDSQGNMKTLDEVMQNLRDAFDGLSETQQTEAAKAIAGQEAMSGLLAIVNAAPADYQKLTKAIQESDGAAESMANTMNDTVEGQLTLLKSQIEGIEIQIYEKLTPALREGLDKIKETLSAIDWNTVGTKLGDFANKAINLFVKIIDNAEGIIDIMKSVGTVLAATFIVTKIASFASGILSMVKTFQALKAATDIATTSQLLLNAAQAATPIGLVTAAVAALAAGVIYLASKNQEAEETTKALTEAEEAQIEKINEMNQAYAEMKTTRDESVKAVTSEYDHYKELAKELDGLVDANGAVKEADQDRANFIISTLNEALGTEIEMIDGVIQNYQEEKAAIEDLMNIKKAEAVLRANEEAYTTAIQNQNEALTNMINAQELYRQKRDEVNKLESQAQHLASMSVEEYAAQNDLLWDMGTAANQLANDQEEMAQKILIAKSAMGEANVACHNAETAYTNYETAIQNYEGLSSAIISGDQKKISEALSNQMYDFQTAETGTRETLENQVEAYKDNYEKMEKAVENHAPGVTQAMVAEAKEMLKKSKAELAKLPPETEKSAKNAGNAAAKGMESTKSANKKAGEDIKKSAQTGAKDNGEMKQRGQAQGKDYATGVESQKGSSKTAGKQLAQEAKKGADTKDASTDSEKSGSHFGEGFFNGIGKWFSKVFSRGKGLSQEATRGLKEGQKEGSPSKITYQSGIYFVQGYINGIVSQQSKLKGTVKDMVSGVISILQNVDGYNFDEVGDTASNAYSEALKKKFDYAFNKMSYQNEQKLKEFDDVIDAYTAQQEEAADKIQASGDTLVSQLEASRELAVKEIEANRDAEVKAFETQRDNTIKELELNRDNTVKKLNNQISELEKKISKTSDKDKKKKLQNEKKALQDEITATKNNASAQITAIKNSTKNKVDAIKKAATESINAQKESYNKEIENQKALTKAQIEDSNENYNKLIENENSNKEAYQTASSEMLSQYQSAMNEYQTQAQALIDDTINGITNRYNDNYDDLINKQNTLIKKLQGAGDLFNVSGAGIMTINDLTEQTKAIKEYTSRLQKIKNKVSTELFNEIASFDMKEGNAYMDRLLAMSSKDLEAYNKAYAEKLEAAQVAGDQIYKKDIEQLTKDYKNELKKGFEDLPKNLEELGSQAMQGFINGLTESTDYMSDEIKTYISAMVDTFKKELQINSPSKVMMEIGNYTGIGLVDGLKNTISEVKKTATSMAQTMATPLDSMKTSFGDMKSAVSGPNGSGAVNNSVVNNYNLVQNNNSPKSLSALETYQARRQQVAMIKALT